MRITYDRNADTAYVYLTDEKLPPGRTSIQADTPQGVDAFVTLDWNAGRLVNIEILNAQTTLHHDLLHQAEIID